MSTHWQGLPEKSSGGLGRRREERKVAEGRKADKARPELGWPPSTSRELSPLLHRLRFPPVLLAVGSVQGL